MGPNAAIAAANVRVRGRLGVAIVTTVMEWIAAHVRPTGPPVLVHQRPWSTVSRVATADGVVWFKECAPAQGFEPSLSAGLSARRGPRHCFPASTGGAPRRCASQPRPGSRMAAPSCARGATAVARKGDPVLGCASSGRSLLAPPQIWRGSTRADDRRRASVLARGGAKARPVGLPFRP